MRDNHDGMPEILEAHEAAGTYSAVVAVAFDGVRRAYQFAVSKDSYRALRRVLQTRPFGTPAGVAHRYFFARSAGRAPGTATAATFAVRVEAGRDARQIEFQAPLDLAANLMWFGELKSPPDSPTIIELPLTPASDT
jgi:hypothetical protein